jgi:chemotaxis protein CheD
VTAAAPMLRPRAEGMPSTYLHPGQVAAFAEPTQVTTILGSCVSICLFDERLGLGGLNHFVLPDLSVAEPSARFAGPAFEELLERMRAIGARVSQLQAKVFGGSDSLGLPDEGSIGARNVTVARALLSLCDIPIVAEDVGGTAGRKLLFDTRDGTAWVRRLGGRS